ncbi:MAG: type II secretion system F family protein [Candidatus Margulisbacteria bacterium]|nr:type II secretion system F family protein [Candidatus Margulisiibacteriota bacterium]
MTKFKYKAVNEKGAPFEDEIEASSAEEVYASLTAKGFTPVNISEKLNWPDFTKTLGLHQYLKPFSRVGQREIMLFFRQLSALFSAGVSLFESLTALEEQFNKEKIKEVIIKIRTDVAGGATFSGALAKFPNIFSNLTVAMVAAGERAGAMDEVLKKIAAFLEKEAKLKMKLHGAFRYPAVLLGVLCLAGIFAITAIIPKFKAVFSAFKTELPLPTRFLLGINLAFTNYWWLIVIICIVIYFAYRFYHSTSAGRYNIDQLFLKMPVFGLLITKVSLARFFTMLSAMISSGISIVSGLEITANTADNAVIADAIIKIREKVISGVSLSDSMREFPVFPISAVHMAAIGEKSGTLENMLAKSAEYFDEEADYTIANLMILLEPILIFIMGIGVLIFALGIFLPMWNLMSLFK